MFQAHPIRWGGMVSEGLAGHTTRAPTWMQPAGGLKTKVLGIMSDAGAHSTLTFAQTTSSLNEPITAR